MFLFGKKRQIGKIAFAGKTKKRRIKFFLVSIRNIIRITIWHLLVFSFSLLLYLLGRIIAHILKWRLFPKNSSQKFQEKLAKFYTRITKILGIYQEGSISQIDLIELAIRNLKVKKTRTLITIGGMSIGIAAIVFLVSIGYGLQTLVISRVTRLDEMKQIEIDPQTGGRLKITDETLASLKDISGMDMALPMIAVVGRVNFQNSVSDMVVYGVTTDYLKQSAIQPVQGGIFSSNEVSSPVSLLKNEGEVAGVTDNEPERAELGKEIGRVKYEIFPNTWIRIREGPETGAKIIGYTHRMQNSGEGTEIWGEKFESDESSGTNAISENNESFGKWIRSSVPLWKKENCEKKDVCIDGKYSPLQDDSKIQKNEEGYFAEMNLSVIPLDPSSPKVLGEIDSEAESQISENQSQNVDWVDLESGANANKTADQAKQVSLPESSTREAVVNRSMLKVLGLNENEAVGKIFNTSFIVVGDLLQDVKEKIESEPAEYKIVGVIPDDKTPLFYVPFIDLRSLGVVNYSQVKAVVKDKNVLDKIRQQIEAMGYPTHSVVDTVNQVNNIFGTARTVLALVGMVALAVASLGMFNTLTVSLLERTREVGLMKAMGMKSIEVRELFLTESMIMGFFGGILGIILGFLAGKAVGLVLSAYSLSRGQGYIDISTIPVYFAVVVILLSLTVGVVTGIYPARRAKKISALDALRYE
jgi:ABC-type antimicrobial peptide transport system permease subunit